jgi:hypothetical protein
MEMVSSKADSGSGHVKAGHVEAEAHRVRAVSI